MGSLSPFVWLCPVPLLNPPQVAAASSEALTRLNRGRRWEPPPSHFEWSGSFGTRVRAVETWESVASGSDQAAREMGKST